MIFWYGLDFDDERTISLGTFNINKVSIILPKFHVYWKENF